MSISHNDFVSLWKSIDVLEAQEQIVATTVGMFPKLKRNAQTERNKKLYKEAYPRDIYKRTSKDAASSLLAKLGGGNVR